MCGRTITSDTRAIAEFFEIENPPEAWMTPHFNIAPSQPIGVMRAPHRLELLRWGIQREPKKPLQINTRVETVAKTIARQKRCIVPVDGFYEWKRDGSKVTQPYLLRDAHGRPLAFAGLWHAATTADGEIIEAVSIVTCPPKPPVTAIHDRMPLVIPREACDRWLSADADVSDLLAPASTELVAIPVSARVNSPKNDDPSLIERAEPVQGGLF